MYNDYISKIKCKRIKTMLNIMKSENIILHILAFLETTCIKIVLVSHILEFIRLRELCKVQMKVRFENEML